MKIYTCQVVSAQFLSKVRPFIEKKASFNVRKVAMILHHVLIVTSIHRFSLFALSIDRNDLSLKLLNFFSASSRGKVKAELLLSGAV